MIRSVSDGELMIGDNLYKSTVALTSDKILDSWCDKTVAQLCAEDFKLLLESNPEIIILGTGTSNVFAPRELVFALARQNVGLEVGYKGCSAHVQCAERRGPSNFRSAVPVGALHALRPSPCRSCACAATITL